MDGWKFAGPLSESILWVVFCGVSPSDSGLTILSCSCCCAVIVRGEGSKGVGITVIGETQYVVIPYMPTAGFTVPPEPGSDNYRSLGSTGK